MYASGSLVYKKSALHLIQGETKVTPLRNKLLGGEPQLRFIDLF